MTWNIGVGQVGGRAWVWYVAACYTEGGGALPPTAPDLGLLLTEAAHQRSQPPTNCMGALYIIIKLATTPALAL